MLLKDPVMQEPGHVHNFAQPMKNKHIGNTYPLPLLDFSVGTAEKPDQINYSYALCHSLFLVCLDNSATQGALR
jgi:hypothetical protein